MNNGVDINDFRLEGETISRTAIIISIYRPNKKRQLSFNLSNERQKIFPTHQRRAIVGSKGQSKINNEKYFLLATTIIGTKADFSIVKRRWKILLKSIHTMSVN